MEGWVDGVGLGWVVAGLFGEDSEVGWDDGEEQEEDAGDLGDVELVVVVEVVGAEDGGEEGQGDDDSGNGPSPGTVIKRKHGDTPSKSDASCRVSGYRRPGLLLISDFRLGGEALSRN